MIDEIFDEATNPFDQSEGVSRISTVMNDKKWDFKGSINLKTPNDHMDYYDNQYFKQIQIKNKGKYSKSVLKTKSKKKISPDLKRTYYKNNNRIFISKLNIDNSAYISK